MGFRYGEAEVLKQYFRFAMQAIFQQSHEDMLASMSGNKKTPYSNKPQAQKKEETVDEDVVW